MYNFKESNCAFFKFLTPSSITVRFLGENSFQVNPKTEKPFQKGAEKLVSRDRNRKSRKLSTFEVADKHGRVPIHLDNLTVTFVWSSPH